MLKQIKHRKNKILTKQRLLHQPCSHSWEEKQMKCCKKFVCRTCGKMWMDKEPPFETGLRTRTFKEGYHERLDEGSIIQNQIITRQLIRKINVPKSVIKEENQEISYSFFKSSVHGGLFLSKMYVGIEDQFPRHYPPRIKPGILTTDGVVGGGVPAIPSCDPAINEIGLRTTSGTGANTVGDYIYCFRRAADCSGKLSKASMYLVDTQVSEIKLCLYSCSGSCADTAPTSAATLTHCETLSGSTGATLYESSVINDHAVVSGQFYWVCYIGETTTKQWSYSRIAGGGRYIQNIVGSYASPPANLDGTWTGPTADYESASFFSIQ